MSECEQRPIATNGRNGDGEQPLGSVVVALPVDSSKLLFLGWIDAVASGKPAVGSEMSGSDGRTGEVVDVGKERKHLSEAPVDEPANGEALWNVCERAGALVWGEWKRETCEHGDQAGGEQVVDQLVTAAKLADGVRAHGRELGDCDEETVGRFDVGVGADVLVEAFVEILAQAERATQRGTTLVGHLEGVVGHRVKVHVQHKTGCHQRSGRGTAESELAQVQMLLKALADAVVEDLQPASCCKREDGQFMIGYWSYIVLTPRSGEQIQLGME